MILKSYSSLVSVIIPCYNHGLYLAEAIQSVLNQTYKLIEVIVVDDGSIDNTKDVADSFPNVRYVFQENQGLSAARNAGVLNSFGDYLVFLDADDLLVDDAIEYNLNCLVEGKNLAFVSGGYLLETSEGKKITKTKDPIYQNNYLEFLKKNYIEMHATVMYRRWVFDDFKYDTSLKACEDYDLYLKISRKFPVYYHSKILAIYRMHGTNMSGNSELMLNSVLKVLNLQKTFLRTEDEHKALDQGIQYYKRYYTNRLFRQLNSGHLGLSDIILKTYNIELYYKLRRNKLKNRVGEMKFLRKYLPAPLARFFFKRKRDNSYTPPPMKVNLGDLDRIKPLSKEFGFDRGGAIDRYFIENFLEKESDSIKGKVLEIVNNYYTLRFGKNKVKESVIIDINKDNPKANFFADLSHAPGIPDDSFDCIILTQTLQFIYDFKAAIATCNRILKPGGTLLLTVPGITPIDYDEDECDWLWSFTDKAMKKLIEEQFHSQSTVIKTYGNVLVASAFLYGMGVSEIRMEDLDYRDPNMQVIITVKAIKKSIL
jgi:glycosyltransferase involved in cell wall biosynthesis